MGRLFPAGIQLLFVEQIAGEAHYVIVAPKQQQKVFILHNFRQLLVVLIVTCSSRRGERCRESSWDSGRTDVLGEDMGQHSQ